MALAASLPAMMKLSPRRSRSLFLLSLTLSLGMTVTVHAQSTPHLETLLQSKGIQDGDNFGYALAFDGERSLLIGVPVAIEDEGEREGQVHLWSRTAGGNWVPGAILRGPQETALGFGASLALDDQTLVVGAPDSLAQSTKSGEVYVYRRSSGGGWSLTQRLTPPTNQADDRFGWSVAIEGNTLVVGAPGEDTAPKKKDSGAIYIYERSGSGTWTLSSKELAPNAAARDSFGQAVAIDQGRIAAGAPGQLGVTLSGAPSGTPQAGRVHLYRKSGNAWRNSSSAFLQNPMPTERFGSSLAFDQGTLLVGAPGYDIIDRNSANPQATAVLNRGIAYVMRQVGSSWRKQMEFKPVDSRSETYFGSSLRSDAGRVIIGSRVRGSNPRAGRADLWSRTPNSTAWTYMAGLEPAPRTASGNRLRNLGFGDAVAIKGDFAVVGAPFADRSSATNTGAAYAYRLSGPSSAPALPAWLQLLTGLSLAFAATASWRVSRA